MFGILQHILNIRGDNSHFEIAADLKNIYDSKESYKLLFCITSEYLNSIDRLYKNIVFCMDHELIKNINDLDHYLIHEVNLIKQNNTSQSIFIHIINYVSEILSICIIPYHMYCSNKIDFKEYELQEKYFFDAFFDIFFKFEIVKNMIQKINSYLYSNINKETLLIIKSYIEDIIPDILYSNYCIIVSLYNYDSQKLATIMNQCLSLCCSVFSSPFALLDKKSINLVYPNTNLSRIKKRYERIYIKYLCLFINKLVNRQEDLLEIDIIAKNNDLDIEKRVEKEDVTLNKENKRKDSEIQEDDKKIINTNIDFKYIYLFILTGAITLVTIYYLIISKLEELNEKKI